MDIKKIFLNLIEEAKNAKIILGGDEFPIGFNTIIYDGNIVIKNIHNERNNSTLIIKDLNVFLYKLTEYINTEKSKKRFIYNFLKTNENDYVKSLISFLMVNASINDFNEPDKFITKYIEFLNDKTFDEFNNEKIIDINNTPFQCKLKIKNYLQSTMMETPNNMEFTLINNDDKEFNLPTISYGIKTNELGEKECYIYSILNKEKKEFKDEEEEKFKKRISRLLYKVNKGIEKDEDIYNVSPSSIISLSIFLSILKNKNIDKIKVVPYLPIRYLSREITSYNVKDTEEYQERNDFIQSNATNKFLNTFLRLVHHRDDLKIESYPLESDDLLTLKLTKQNSKIDNDLLNEIASTISK